MIIRNSLLSGNSKSCGCLRNELVTKHGVLASKDFDKRFYTIWVLMRQRCYNPNHHAYKRYGDRGITVCERWHTFKNFYDDMYAQYCEHKNKYGRDETSIDRVDNNKGYSIENCRWATRKEQANNTRANIHIIYKNVSYTRSEFLKMYHVEDVGCIFEKDSERMVRSAKEKIARDVKKEFQSRNLQISELRNTWGFTLEEIGKLYGVSRERVRQISHKLLMKDFEEYYEKILCPNPSTSRFQ